MKKILIILSVSIIGVISYFFSDIPLKSSPKVQTDQGYTVDQFDVENYISPISVDFLRGLIIEGSALTIEETLSSGIKYSRYIVSYQSDGLKIFGLLTVPMGDIPEGGFPAIVFNHGYIPPHQYITTEKYTAYVDYLARNGFVVFKIDMRGHGNSEGNPSGSYFSSAYTIDAISALKSLQTLEYVNPERIGIWGHSMAGNLALRAMLVEDDFKAGAIWAGAVYSYKDFVEYRLNDSSYVRPPETDQTSDRVITLPGTGPVELDGTPPPTVTMPVVERDASEQIRNLRNSTGTIDFNDKFWTSISLTKNLNYLNSPIQLHHAVNDSVVNIGYSRDLVKVSESLDKDIELFEYSGGGHNIESPYFEQAMQRTVDFFEENL